MSGPTKSNQQTTGLALNNEKINLQIVLPPMNKENNEEISVEYHIKSNLLDAAKLYKVGHVPVGNVANNKEDDDILENEGNLYPDVLYPIALAGEISVHSDHWTSLWLEINLGEIEDVEELNAIEFHYEIGEQTTSITYQLEVINESLPKQKMIHTEWFHTDSLCYQYEVEPFSEEYWEIVENYVKMAYDHSQNTIMTPIFTPPLDTEEGEERLTIQLVGMAKDEDSYAFDFTKLTRWSEMLKKVGIEYIEFPPFFTQWGAKFTPKIIVNEQGQEEKKFGWHVSYDSPEYEAFLNAFLPELNQWVEENGWAEKIFIHVSDEPNEDSLKNYQYGKELLKKYLTTGTFIDALSDYTFYKNNLVDIPVAGTPSIDGFLNKDVENLWAYYCGVHSDKVSNRYIAQQARRTRIIGFQLYKEDTQGFLHWGYNFWFTQLSKAFIDPYQVTDSGGGFPSGDAFVVYPGENNAPIPSLRLKLINEAFQDIRACELLEQLTDKETVWTVIEKHIPNLNFYSHGEEIQAIDALRDEINQKIKEIHHD